MDDYFGIIFGDIFGKHIDEIEQQAGFAMLFDNFLTAVAIAEITGAVIDTDIVENGGDIAVFSAAGAVEFDELAELFFEKSDSFGMSGAGHGAELTFLSVASAIGIFGEQIKFFFGPVFGIEIP